MVFYQQSSFNHIFQIHIWCVSVRPLWGFSIPYNLSTTKYIVVWIWQKQPQQTSLSSLTKTYFASFIIWCSFIKWRAIFKRNKIKCFDLCVGVGRNLNEDDEQSNNFSNWGIRPHNKIVASWNKRLFKNNATQWFGNSASGLLFRNFQSNFITFFSFCFYFPYSKWMHWR